MTNDGGVVARGSGESTTVTSLLFDVADNGTFGALRDGENVSDVQGGLLSTVDEGTSVETLGSNEGLLAELVAVGVPEDDTGKRSTTIRYRLMEIHILNEIERCEPASIVNDLLYNTLDVSIAFGEVERAELGRGLVVVGVRFELDSKLMFLLLFCE